MKTNTQAEEPEPLVTCSMCGEEICCCDKCEEMDFEDGDEILCYKKKHYCEECADKIKNKRRKTSSRRIKWLK